MSNIYTLAEAVSRLESVSDSAQKLFSELLYRHYYGKKEPVIGVYIDRLEDINALENAALLIRVDDPKPQLDAVETHARQTNQPLLYERLVSLGYTDRKKSWDHVGFCLEHPDLIEKVAFDGIAVVITPALEKGWRKVYTYLNWKFEDDGYFDGEWHDCPKGAKYIGKMGIFTSESKSGWYYPDNDVSHLLEKYGHLRCPIWDGPKEDFSD